MIGDINDCRIDVPACREDAGAGSQNTFKESICRYDNQHAALVVKSWWALADYLVYKYADGNVYTMPPTRLRGRARLQGIRYGGWR